ncbi:hypothetical protein JOQ06_016102 [Pogonophryne albipinna]|uniref:Uncharacterized protein n=1 Tax=Pogonophryne albipinna TaxID=1090488 RepID=A0AAD6AMM7_9TELE|nr:hypothetical protein JOQ06_016102 [Pogonophryne albipinna]
MEGGLLLSEALRQTVTHPPKDCLLLTARRIQQFPGNEARAGVNVSAPAAPQRACWWRVCVGFNRWWQLHTFHDHSSKRFAKQIENLRCSGPSEPRDFFEALDQHTPRFIQLFKSKKGSVGQKLQSINWPTPDVTEQRSVVLKGIPIALGDDSKNFFKTCFDTTRDEALSSVTVGVLTVLSEDSPQEGPSSMQLEPISTDIVLEGGIVMEKIKNFPQACYLA